MLGEMDGKNVIEQDEINSLEEKMVEKAIEN